MQSKERKARSCEGDIKQCTLGTHDGEPVTSPFWPVEDVWPPGTLSKDCMRAYKLLEQRGELEIIKVHFSRQTLVTRVEYLTMEPLEAARRALLRQARADAMLMNGGEQLTVRNTTNAGKDCCP